MMKYILIALCCLSTLNIWAQLRSVEKPVAYYPFNSTAEDAGRFKNNGEIRGGVFPATDRFGNECGALQFNGSNGYIHVPHSYSLSKPQKEYTISVWFKALDGSEYSDLQWMTICCKSDINDETPNSPQYRLQSTRYTVSMNTDFTENFDHKIEFDKWYFYTVTYDGTTCTVYLNNKKLTSWTYATEFKKNTYNLNIGRDLPGNIEYFCGVMDELRIYDYALSKAEVLRLYYDKRDKNSKKPCDEEEEESPVTPPVNPTPTNPTTTTPTNPTTNPTTTTPCPDPIPCPEVKPCHNLPAFVGGDTIEYQQTVTVKSSDVRLFFYDAEKEDGDIVSVNFNGAWILQKHKLRKKTSTTPPYVDLTLIPGVENYFFTKAWNLGSIPPNTLTVEIQDAKNRKTKTINITSKIGKSGAIKLVYEP